MKHTILTLVLAIPLIFATPTAFASDFRGASWGDDMSDTSSTLQKLYTNPPRYISTSNLDYLGFRCDVSTKGKSFFLTFSSNKIIATPNNPRVKLKIRVDSGKVYEVKARMFNSSYHAGSIKEFPKELIVEMKKGSKLLVYIYTYNVNLKDQQSFSLSGSNAAISQIENVCGIKSSKGS